MGVRHLGHSVCYHGCEVGFCDVGWNQPSHDTVAGSVFDPLHELEFLRGHPWYRWGVGVS